MQPGHAERERKEKKPHLYCPKCLWMTGDGRPCPRHGGPVWTSSWRTLAQAISRGDMTVKEAQKKEKSGGF